MVCGCAWTLFLLLPGAFFLLASPGLVQWHGPALLAVALCLFALTALLYVIASCTDPGVAPRGYGMHPGPQYTYCVDSNRYVAGFDHFCDFMGNDVGARNMPFFVCFLLSIGSLSSYLAVCAVLYVYDMWTLQTPTVHLEISPFRVIAALLLLLLVFGALRRCSKAQCCEGVMPLVMMMPGAYIGAGVIAVVLGSVVILTLMSDMWSHVSIRSNPAPLYLLLPLLAFAVLFLGMSAHWAWLICQGLTQKLWLRAKGWKRKRPVGNAARVEMV